MVYEALCKSERSGIVFDGILWHMMVYDGMWWYMMVNEGEREGKPADFICIFDTSRRYMMVLTVVMGRSICSFSWNKIRHIFGRKSGHFEIVAINFIKFGIKRLKNCKLKTQFKSKWMKMHSKQTYISFYASYCEKMCQIVQTFLDKNLDTAQKYSFHNSV